MLGGVRDQDPEGRAAAAMRDQCAGRSRVAVRALQRMPTSLAGMLKRKVSFLDYPVLIEDSVSCARY